MAYLIDTIVEGAIIHKEGTAIKNGTSVLQIDYSTGTTFEINLVTWTNQIDTINVINVAGGTYYKSFILHITQASPATGFSWASIGNVKWPGGGAGAPTITGYAGSAGKKDILSFSSWDDGTTWYGKVIGQNYS